MHPLHVLIVDDSAVVRQVLADLLRREPGFVVTAAADPFIALDKMRQQRPDVLLLDLELPRMDGLTFLAKLMAEDPLPVVVCSGVAQRGTEAALRALSGGALDVVPKPSLGVRSFLEESAVMLADTLRAAAQARPRRLAPAPQPTPARPAQALGRTTDQVVAVGASTGGTEALRALLGSLPPDSPGLVIVQHMPAVFTATFAQGLNRSTALEVKEAEDGDRLLEGRALLAPGNRHTELVRSGGHYAVRVFDGPLVSRHRPSVDVLFGSVARAAGANAVGLIMTGMGDDGARGLVEMRQAGAATLAQDEASCVVFGMPREAIRAGAVEVVAPLHELGPRLLAEARRRRVA